MRPFVLAAVLVAGSSPAVATVNIIDGDTLSIDGSASGLWRSTRRGPISRDVSRNSSLGLLKERLRELVRNVPVRYEPTGLTATTGFFPVFLLATSMSATHS